MAIPQFCVGDIVVFKDVHEMALVDFLIKADLNTRFCVIRGCESPQYQLSNGDYLMRVRQLDTGDVYGVYATHFVNLPAPGIQTRRLTVRPT